MGEKTTLAVATTGKESLRTTMPIAMIRHFNLKAGDKLDWDFYIKDGKMVIIVKPVIVSNGNVAIDKANRL